MERRTLRCLYQDGDQWSNLEKNVALEARGETEKERQDPWEQRECIDYL